MPSTAPRGRRDDGARPARDTELVNILVVDGHTLLRERIAELLREAGHGWRVVTVADAPGLRRLALEGGFDLIVLDTNLAGVDVVALAREVRRAAPDTALVLLSTADVAAMRGRYSPIAGAQLVGKHELGSALIPAVQRALAWRDDPAERGSGH